MAVKLKVKSEKKVAKSKTAIIVDRIVELKKVVDAMMKDEGKELAQLTAQLREQAMAQDPDQVVSFSGTNSTVLFGEAARTRALVDLVGAKKALGNDTFFEVAKVNLGDLDKYLTAEEIAPLIENTRGARKMDLVSK